jgi:deoxyribonuclease (pyrimidine dimer)
MTRINIGIPVKDLTRQHLLAEHRELVRIPNTIKSGKAVVKDIPDQFTLGKGHVKFFYTRLKYLHDRYNQLHRECVERGYNVTDFSSAFTDLPDELYNDYLPTEGDTALVKQRIEERLSAMKRK